MKNFIIALYSLAIDMGYYMVIGLLLVSVFNILIKKEWIAKHLGGNSLWAIIKASILGVPLPLCSCGVIPTGLYLKDNGASKAATTSFLISTPQTGVDSIVATYGLMDITFAWFRPLAAFLSGIIGGVSVKIFGASKKNDDMEVSQIDSCKGTNCDVENEQQVTIAQKIKKSLSYAFGEFVSGIAFHFIIGLIIAALITVLLPAGLLVEIGLSQGILSMLVMIIVGAPMYICSTSSIPIALALIAKGLSPGTAFVFLFMGPFTNIASIAVLSKKLGIKTTVIYLVSASLSAIGFGYLLDFLINRFNLFYFGKSGMEGMHMSFGTIKTIIGLIFIVIVLYHITKLIVAKIRDKAGEKNKKGEPTILLSVFGMSCEGCVSGLKSELLTLKDIDAVEISLDQKQAKIWGSVDLEKVKEIVLSKGYTTE